MKSHDDLIPIALDTETDRIGPGTVAPKLMCASFAWREPTGELSTLLLGNGDDVEGHLTKVFSSPRHLILFHKAGYDLAVIASSYPSLIPLIFSAIIDGRTECNIIREKLINLSTHGQLETIALPDGSSAKIGYHLTDLGAKYLGRNRAAEKAGGEDIWRLNYRELDGFKAVDYPDEASKYALDDAIDTLEVWEVQEERTKADDGQTDTSRFRTAADFCLTLMTCWGFAVDQQEVARIEEILTRELAPDRLNLLIESGILRKPEASRIHANQIKKAKALCMEWGENWDNFPLTEEQIDWPHTFVLFNDRLRANGVKFTKEIASSRDTEKLKAYIVGVCREYGRDVKLTDTGIDKANGKRYVSCDDPIALEYASADADFLDQLAVYEDQVLQQYSEREELSKIVGTYMPVLRGADVVHFNYNALVETGRTSSFGVRKGKTPLYPCTNGQNQPDEVRGISIRHAFVSRPMRVLWDVDFQALELACTGQITKNLFGDSVHLRRYNEGVDLHGYLGAQLALRLGKDQVAKTFQQACIDEGIVGDHMATYLAFQRCKGQDGDLGKFYKHYRNFAKPVGLGYPGGLGAETMVTFARTTYGVKMTVEEAREFKEVWLFTYPEMPEYFKWVAKQIDDRNPSIGLDNWGKPQMPLMYVTPLGMLRRGAAFCDVANGMAMQSPGAEGAVHAVIKVSRACYDPTQGSLLYGCRPIAFVHDQIIGETKCDQESWHDECMEVSRLMCEAMEPVLPDVRMRTEPLLTTVWSKKAVPVYDENKRLVPWIPG